VQEREKILNKLSLENRTGIIKLNKNDDIKKAAKAWQDHLQKLRQISLDVAMERLDEASEQVQSMQNVVAI
jgi:hypothetical protein